MGGGKAGVSRTAVTPPHYASGTVVYHRSVPRRQRGNLIVHDKPPRVWGPEVWATIDGQDLTYWDLWFLALVVDLGGFDKLRQAIRDQQSGSWRREDVEAKLSHLADLDARLNAMSITATELVGKLVDKPLLRKAQTKVFKQAASHKSAAMINTPRRRLYDRALRGYWSRFPVSPDRFEREFLPVAPDGGRLDAFATSMLADGFEELWQLKASALEEPAQLLGLHRALMTVLVEVMESARGEGISVLAVDVCAAYVRVRWESTGIAPDVYIRDGIELLVWEDYCLFDDGSPFFKSIPTGQGELTRNILSELRTELEAFELDYNQGKLLTLWSQFLIAHKRFDEFGDLAAVIGSKHWIPVVELAGAAVKARRTEVAMAVFAAADHPGTHRQHLAEECARLLGASPAECRRRALRAV